MNTQFNFDLRIFPLLVSAIVCGVLSSCADLIASKEPTLLNGAGASFPAPLYQRWITEYSQEKKGSVTINYDSVGSGNGVKKFLAQEVDFGASDAPLKSSEKDQFPSSRNRAIQIPLTGGLVVFAYNLSDFEGTEEIRLSRQSYCGIVTGKIKNWRDPQIMADNPNTRMPNLPIIFVHRADGSGTTFMFSTHIQAACPEWQGGAGKEVEWSPGFLGAEGNEGVTAQIQQTQGAIGYIEYSYARSNKLSMATLQNKAGEFVVPSPDQAAQSFASVDVPEDFAISIPDPSQPQAYPIVGLTWLLLYGNYEDSAKAKSLQEFVTWAVTKGDDYAKELGYVPIPTNLEQRVLMIAKQL